MEEDTVKKLVQLYISVNEMVAILGANGEVSSRDQVVDNVMDALFYIDDGAYDVKEFKKRLITDTLSPLDQKSK